MTDFRVKPGKVRGNWKCSKWQSENQVNFIMVVNETIEVRIYPIKKIKGSLLISRGKPEWNRNEKSLPLYLLS